MERIIKFRGKRVDNGKWVYGYYGVTQINHGIWTRTDGKEFPEWYQVLPETVGQCVGVFNGFEMYHGDIFKRILDKKNQYKKDSEWADYWLVEWIKEDACFTTTCVGDNDKGKFKKVVGWQSKTNPYSKRFNEMDEYIGNIHDNPELLRS